MAAAEAPSTRASSACSITAYGKRGPWKDEPPIEDLVLARTGLLAGMPGFRPAPVHVVHPLPSVGAALYAANGIAAALLAREKTGRGRLGRDLADGRRACSIRRR